MHVYSATNIATNIGNTKSDGLVSLGCKLGKGIFERLSEKFNLYHHNTLRQLHTFLCTTPPFYLMLVRMEREERKEIYSDNISLNECYFEQFEIPYPLEVFPVVSANNICSA